jgi:HPt (histidine-containing phosphotransfer) domain-containing protein
MEQKLHLVSSWPDPGVWREGTWDISCALIMTKTTFMRNDSRQIDETAALSILGGDRQLLGELAEIFGEDAPQLVAEFEAALENNNLATARRIVHSLKGLSSTFFAKSLTDLAGQLEEELDRGSMAILNQGGARQLRDYVESVIQELRSLGHIKSTSHSERRQ